MNQLHSFKKVAIAISFSLLFVSAKNKFIEKPSTMNKPSSTHQVVAEIKHFPSIRYAEPPIGNLRFAPPQPVAFNPSLLSTKVPYTVCPQTPSRLARVMGDFEATQSEDCLNVSVWTPNTDQKLRPVLFWIHGGGFSSGGGGLDWYNATTLCQEGDIVVVSPNYRLGALGFLCYPGLANGNQGIQDIEAALAWTRKNVHHFGGDSNRITVMGQSAGAWSAALLVTRMPKDNPTIHQVILESGSYVLPPNTVEEAQVASHYFLNALKNKKSGLRDLEQVQQASVEDILAAQTEAINQVNKSSDKPRFAPIFGPVSDGVETNSQENYTAYLAKGAQRVPVIVGWTKNEMSAFGSDSSPEAALQGFGNTSKQWAANAQKAGQAAYVYCFDWSPKNSPFGACHTIELPFVFGTFSAYTTAPMLKNADANEMQSVSQKVRASWLAFIKTGSPQVAEDKGLPNWPMFDAKTGSVMHIDVKSHVVSEPIK